MPRGGECAKGKAIGTDGCTWRRLKRLHTLELSCVLEKKTAKTQGLDMLAVCKKEKYPPYPKSTQIFEDAFKQGSGGCPDVCHLFAACPKGDEKGTAHGTSSSSPPSAVPSPAAHSYWLPGNWRLFTPLRL
jgi:hypothetical protein